jgi:hypothetical protein
MKSIWKWSGVAAGVLLALAVMGAGYIFFASQAIIARDYQPERTAFHAPSDAAAVARGAHLAVVTGCTDCHLADLTGRQFSDVPDATIWSRNLTLLGHSFSDAEFERAISSPICAA